MELRRAYRFNAPAVARQTLEGETILIHFDSGHYYSCNAAGTMILDALASGCPPADLAAPPDFADDVARFVQMVIAERIVVEADMAGAGASPHTGGDVREPPLLEKFTDLEDLLLLDPIHEVDTAGWPARPPEPKPK